ncbi:MAG: hypothetical protein PSV35_07445 [bacterium]|nr:hypothetical protein [bacterium]
MLSMFSNFRFSFFKQSLDSPPDHGTVKLAGVIELIKKNKSFVASCVLEVLLTKKLVIKSFYELSQNHYDSIRQSIETDLSTTLTTEFPPTPIAIEKIEAYLEGIIFDRKIIYLNFKKDVSQIASTLIHEVSHYLNSTILDEERVQSEEEDADYCDEVRAFMAEKMFQRNGACLTRSAVKDVHTMVTDLYPEFNNVKQPNKKGFVFSYYDKPAEETFNVMSSN